MTREAGGHVGEISHERSTIQMLKGKIVISKKSLMSLFLAAVVVGGCGVEDYNVIVKNVGNRTIDDAHVVYGEFRSIGGIIIPRSEKGHGHPQYPIPTTATVEWRTEDGQMHRKEVEVKSLVPKSFSGDIVFEIDDGNNVTVRTVPRQKLSI
jgi:hypothetical protein